MKAKTDLVTSEGLGSSVLSSVGAFTEVVMKVEEAKTKLGATTKQMMILCPDQVGLQVLLTGETSCC